MINLKEFEFWFITGSQHLYGPGPLAQVAEHSKEIAAALDSKLPVKIVFKPVLTGPDAITQLAREANATANCAGVIAWMHTFSPAKMWIAGLSTLSKPLAHLHTQYGRDIPWSSIDMDFMNLNQSAHGDREFGFIGARLRKGRKIVVGHWQDKEVISRLDAWTRAAAGWADAQGARIARIGDNMREVAVTEGDKVEAQRVFGYSVNGYGLGDVVAHVDAATDAQIEQLCKEYDAKYVVAKELGPKGARRASLRDAARIEIGLRSFLASGNFKGFTDTFENLHGLKQLPGIAAQRLMNDGYGFGAEGDWKTAALLRAMKVMATGLKGGTSFMEDYTYHLDPKGSLVLGAHMLEICESIAAAKPSCGIHPLGIGGKEDPVRLVFDTPADPALNASVIDLGNRFRMIVNTVDVVKTPHPLPKLPVARAVWKAHPDLKIAAGAWILAGGAHHTGFSQALTVEHLRDFTDIAGIEFLLIDQTTDIHQFKKEVQWNEVFYHLKSGLR